MTPQVFSKKSFVKIVSVFVLISFVAGSLGIPQGYAAGISMVPDASRLVALSPRYMPAVLRGIKLYAQEPFKLTFAFDEGDSNLSQKELKEESALLIRYFLAALTMPEEDLWVNLSPYEKDRVVPGELGLTDMGQDMLAQDYALKQLSASVTYPESPFGAKFWDKVYAKAHELYGVTNIPMNTFNKIWIVPDTAVIYEEGDKAVVGEAKLKVMMEADYRAMQKMASNPSSSLDSRVQNALNQDPKNAQEANAITSQIMREIIVPVIEKEVNSGKNFAQLRQMYYSLILASWFKDKLRMYIGALGQDMPASAPLTIFSKYIDQKKINGVDARDPQVKEKIYNQYVEAYKKGVYDYFKKELDTSSRKLVRRHYYSGGVVLAVKNKRKIVPAKLDTLPIARTGRTRVDKLDFVLRPAAPGQSRIAASPVTPRSKTPKLVSSKRSAMYKLLDKDGRHSTSILIPSTLLPPTAITQEQLPAGGIRLTNQRNQCAIDIIPGRYFGDKYFAIIGGAPMYALDGTHEIDLAKATYSGNKKLLDFLGLAPEKVAFKNMNFELPVKKNRTYHDSAVYPASSFHDAAIYAPYTTDASEILEARRYVREVLQKENFKDAIGQKDNFARLIHYLVIAGLSAQWTEEALGAPEKFGFPAGYDPLDGLFESIELAGRCMLALSQNTTDGSTMKKILNDVRNFIWTSQVGTDWDKIDKARASTIQTKKGTIFQRGVSQNMVGPEDDPSEFRIAQAIINTDDEAEILDFSQEGDRAKARAPVQGLTIEEIFLGGGPSTTGKLLFDGAHKMTQKAVKVLVFNKVSGKTYYKWISLGEYHIAIAKSLNPQANITMISGMDDIFGDSLKSLHQKIKEKFPKEYQQGKIKFPVGRNSALLESDGKATIGYPLEFNTPGKLTDGSLVAANESHGVGFASFLMHFNEVMRIIRNGGFFSLGNGDNPYLYGRQCMIDALKEAKESYRRAITQGKYDAQPKPIVTAVINPEGDRKCGIDVILILENKRTGKKIVWRGMREISDFPVRNRDLFDGVITDEAEAERIKKETGYFAYLEDLMGVVSGSQFKNTELSENQSNALVEYLRENLFIDKEGMPLDKLRRAKKHAELGLQKIGLSDAQQQDVFKIIKEGKRNKFLVNAAFYAVDLTFYVKRLFWRELLPQLAKNKLTPAVEKKVLVALEQMSNDELIAKLTAWEKENPGQWGKKINEVLSRLATVHNFKKTMPVVNGQTGEIVSETGYSTEIPVQNLLIDAMNEFTVGNSRPATIILKILRGDLFFPYKAVYQKILDKLRHAVKGDSIWGYIDRFMADTLPGGEALDVLANQPAYQGFLEDLLAAEHKIYLSDTEEIKELEPARSTATIQEANSKYNEFFRLLRDYLVANEAIYERKWCVKMIALFAHELGMPDDIVEYVQQGEILKNIGRNYEESQKELFLLVGKGLYDAGVSDKKSFIRLMDEKFSFHEDRFSDEYVNLKKRCELAIEKIILPYVRKNHPRKVKLLSSAQLQQMAAIIIRGILDHEGRALRILGSSETLYDAEKATTFHEVLHKYVKAVVAYHDNASNFSAVYDDTKKQIPENMQKLGIAILRITAMINHASRDTGNTMQELDVFINKRIRAEKLGDEGRQVLQAFHKLFVSNPEFRELILEARDDYDLATSRTTTHDMSNRGDVSFAESLINQGSVKEEDVVKTDLLDPEKWARESSSSLVEKQKNISEVRAVPGSLARQTASNGGIDFNRSNLNIETRGTGMDTKLLSASSSNASSAVSMKNFTGFSFTIINITKVPNICMALH